MAIETSRLLLRKALPSDADSMYRNLWSRPESFRHTFWSPSASPEEAKERMARTIRFQKNHDSFLVIEKTTGEAIGFAGVEREEDTVWAEAGICLGPDYVRNGFGTEILLALIRYVRQTFGATAFVYRTQEANIPSKKLAEKTGFRRVATETVPHPQTGDLCSLAVYRLDFGRSV